MGRARSGSGTAGFAGATYPQPPAAGATGGGGQSSTFVYQPGGIKKGNVYASWPAMMAAVALVAGPKIVQVDDSIVSPAVIPAGSWDLGSCELWGYIDETLGAGNNTLATCADGCKFLRLFRTSNGLNLTSVSTSAVIEAADHDVLYLDEGAAIDCASGAYPFVDASPARAGAIPNSLGRWRAAHRQRLRHAPVCRPHGQSSQPARFDGDLPAPRARNAGARGIRHARGRRE